MKDQPLRVLMIEDSEDDALLTIRELEKGGYNPSYERVQTASGMEKALMEKQWDIILCDYQMPQFNAPAAIALLKKAKMDIPMIIVSGTIGEETAVECMRLGAQDYFVKGKLIRLCPAIARELAEAEGRRGRRQAEERLRQSEARFKSIVSTSREWIWAIDATGVFTFSNPAIENILGYTPGEIILQGAAANLVSEEDMPKMKEILSRSAEQKKGWSNLVLRWKHKDGTYRYLESNAAPIFEGKSELTGFQGSDRDITERMQTEKMLLLIKKAVENSSDAIGIADAQGNHFYQNKAFTELFGYTADELNTLGVDKCLYADKDTARNVFETILKGGSWSGEVEDITKNGRLLTVMLRADAIKNDSGKIIGLLAINTDITKRKETEKALRESEKRLHAITTNIPGVVFQFYATIQGEYGISYVSERMSDFFEMPADTALDALFPTFVSHIHEEDINRFMASVQESVEANAPWNFEGRYIRPSGVMFWFHAMSIPARQEDRLVFDGILLDITERKQAEEALRASDEQYTRLVDTIPDVVIRTDLEGNIIFANDYTLQKGGYKWEEIKGRHILEFVPPEEHARAMQNIARIMTEGKQGPYEYQLLVKDGGIIPFEMTSGVFRSEDGTPCGLVHVCRDISLRKQDEQEKEQLQERLNQSQKMESVGRLAGGVAHDFNNMLGVILGHTELAMERIKPEQPLYTHLREIRKAAERSTNLTRQLLAFARKQTIAPQIIDINETIAGMLKMLQRLIGENIHLVWLPGVNPCQVKIDPSQIDQILANLCVNARDAIEGVGKVSIESGCISCNQAFRAVHPDFTPGDYVLIAVSDDGCGMAKDVQEKLFEPFFTTKEIGKGTGLGLCTVYGIVKQNNGFINVDSKPGQGTTVRIYLPRHNGRNGKPETDKPPCPLIRGKETVLVVEDEPAILNISKIMLEQQGYQVLTAATPGKAIQLAQEQAEQIHLLITDVVMPEMNGRELANKMLSLYPDIKCLFMSGYTADVIAHQGVLDKGVFFIQKPFSRNSLLAKVRDALDRQPATTGTKC
jgi:two-component system, cell cycle sensor histidine kinase and response regulator CckA